MIVPVFWVSRHDNILARGYADSGLLEEILNRSLWRVPGGVDFQHYEMRLEEWPDVEGAVVVLPARHHASPEDVDWFVERVEKLKWSIVVLAGDEEAVWPFERLPETDTRKLWIMQPRDVHSHLSGLIPGGWSPGTREGLRRWKL